MSKPASGLSLTPCLRRAVDEMSIDWQARTVTLLHDLPREERMGVTLFRDKAVQRLSPATADERKAVLGQLLSLLPMQSAPEGAMRVRWELYHKALSDIPADLLELASERLIRTETWFPKPVQIRKAIQKEFEQRIKDKTRLDALTRFEITKHERVREIDQKRRKAVIEAALKGVSA